MKKFFWYRFFVTTFTLAIVIPTASDRVFAQSSIIAQDVQNATQAIEQAQQLYQNQQYQAASQAWQQAIKLLQQQQDYLNQGMALSNLALSEQKLGNFETATIAIASSLELLQNQPENSTQQRILANTLDIQGAIKRSQGQSEAAWQIWLQAEAIYRQLNQEQAVIKTQLNQAQALQDLGYYRRASKILTSLQAQLIGQPDSRLKAATLLNLGNTLRATGNLEQSLVVLQTAVTTAQQIEINDQKMLLGLGNTLLALGNQASESQQNNFSTVALNDSSLSCLTADNQANAIRYYQQAANCYQQTALSSDLNLKVKAQLNLLSLVVQQPQIPVFEEQSSARIEDLISTIKSNLAQLPTTRATIYDRLNLVQSLICLQPNNLQLASPIAQQCPISSNILQPLPWETIEQEANLALQQAQQLQDRQSQAYALGYLGGIYQQTGRLNQAQQLTQQALLTINQTAASETSYLWQWQLARIYQLQNQPELALSAYNATFDTLQPLKQNLAAINPDIQFAFRDRIEPIYRERVELLLQNPNQTNLQQARDTIESLQLAELNNFFREACIDATPQKIEQIDSSAAVVYSIVLKDRLAVILSQPEQPLVYHQTPLANAAEIDRLFENWYANLNPYLTSANPLQPNQTLYNWLIRPFENQLQQHQTDTLVLILDGTLRSIPVAALHDGEQYLVEKYNLALTPGLQLLASQALSVDTLETIAGGLTESRQGFSSLPSVAEEVTEIATLVPSEVLLNENFTRDRLQSQITNLPYPIVHLATHGQFSSRAEDTFLLTWDDRINVTELDQLLQERDLAQETPIELLILSACQTAAGDKRAALGLAGVAIRSGARSTIATLWSIQDDSTAELMTQLYQQLKTSGISKAEALRQAQLSLLRSPKYQHPYYWSAFVLIGNWQ